MLIVTFEGISGCGKSTIIKKLVESLELDHEIKTLATVDPGTTLAGEAIRPIARQEVAKIGSLTQFYLFAAAKAELDTHISLQDDIDVVLMDRHWLSTFVYQVMLGNVPQSLFWLAAEMNDNVPDIEILIDADPSVALKRAKGDSAFEEMKLQAMCRQYYISAPIFAKERVILVDEDIDDLVARSNDLIANRLF